ncbi:MAG: GTPase ObgE [bacterium]
MFKDQVVIQVGAGRGGDGSLSFRREKYEPRGGPDGGDGGRGGDVVIRAEKTMRTLNNFQENQKFVAVAGGPGSGRKKHGKAGASKIVKVPQGTLVFELRDGKSLFLGDLAEDGDELVVAKGGKGGLGNVHFATPSHQAPRVADLGADGDKKRLFLELKLIADVGFIGLPNAGKSTLLSVISNANPKIAAYPFTTLDPNLGVVDLGPYLAKEPKAPGEKRIVRTQPLVLADIPGLIEGAAEGRGLGHKFLRHVERTLFLVHMLDATSGDISQLKKDWMMINDELKRFNPEVVQKPQIVVFNKIDNLLDEQLQQLRKDAKKAFRGKPICFISAGYEEGLQELYVELAKMYDLVKDQPRIVHPKAVFRPLDHIEKAFVISRDEDGMWIVKGKKVEQIVQTTRLEEEDGLMRMFDLLKRAGLIAALEEEGVIPGDEVRIGKWEFTWG